MNRKLAFLATAAVGILGCGDDSTTTTPGGEVTMADGKNDIKFVMNRLLVPQSHANYAMDLIGSGHLYNQLGSIVSTLVGASNGTLDIQGAVDTSVSGGKVVLLLDVKTADTTLRSDPAVEVDVYLGKQTTGMPDFGGTGMFMIDSTQPPAKFFGKLTTGHFTSNNPATTTHPVTIQLELPLVGGVAPIPLTVNGAHLQFDAAPGALSNAQLNGSIKKSDIDGQIIPGLASLLNERLMADPGCPSNCSPQNKQILALLDLGDGNGGNCTNAADGTISMPGDGKIGVCELQANSLLQSILAPDVQIYDASGNYKPNPANTKRDSLSVGLALTAVGAVF